MSYPSQGPEQANPAAVGSTKTFEKPCISLLLTNSLDTRQNLFILKIRPIGLFFLLYV